MVPIPTVQPTQSPVPDAACNPPTERCRFAAARTILCRSVRCGSGLESSSSSRRYRFKRETQDLPLTGIWGGRQGGIIVIEFHFTWLSTSIAMSMNISCSSLIEFSNFIISACRASISASVCLACWVSMIICREEREGEPNGK